MHVQIPKELVINPEFRDLSNVCVAKARNRIFEWKSLWDQDFINRIGNFQDAKRTKSNQR